MLNQIFKVGDMELDTQTLRKFCPVCKLANDTDAVICQHCNAPLNNDISEVPTTQRVEKSIELSEELKERITKAFPPPSSGLLLFLLNKSEPIALCTEQEFVLGRGGALVSKPIFDLSEFEAYAMGVSRSHAIIKAIEDKYVLIDLNSANGTWLNGERLLPAKPHDLPSGAVIQLGRLKLVVIYSHPAGSKKE
jgi:hypothetical protein